MAYDRVSSRRDSKWKAHLKTAVNCMKWDRNNSVSGSLWPHWSPDSWMGCVLWKRYRRSKLVGGIYQALKQRLNSYRCYWTQNLIIIQSTIFRAHKPKIVQGNNCNDMPATPLELNTHTHIHNHSKTSLRQNTDHHKVIKYILYYCCRTKWLHLRFWELQSQQSSAISLLTGVQSYLKRQIFIYHEI